jgi:hypothetical protein
VVVALVGATVAGVVVLPASSIGAAGTAGAASASTSRTRSSRAAVASTGSNQLRLHLSGVSGPAADPSHDLVVSGTASNTGSSPVTDAKVGLRLRPAILTSREAVDRWLSDGKLTPYDAALPGTVKLKAVAPGATVAFTITVPAGRTGLAPYASAFGPRAIAIEVRSKTASLAVLRSTIVWTPTLVATPIRLSMLVPLTAAPASTLAGQPTIAAAAELVSGGRLQRVLAATSGSKIAWAIDPAVLASAQGLITGRVSHASDDLNSDSSIDSPNGSAAGSSADSSSATGSGSAAGSTTTGSTSGAGSSASGSTATGISDAAAANGAHDWLTLFKQERSGRDVLGLPFADPDLTSLLNASQSLPLLRNSDSLGQAATLQALGSPVDTTVAWPGDGKVNGAETSALARTGRTSILLASGNQPPEQTLGYTPTGRSTVRSANGKLQGLLYDEQLSALVTGSGGGQHVADTQTLLAQLAAITLQRPGSARHVLAVTPRGWDPNPDTVQSMIGALQAAPWVSLRNLNELRAADAGPRRKSPIFHKAAVKAELPVGQFSAALALSRDLDTFAPALVNPQPVQPLRERIASLLSFAWRGEPDQLVNARSNVAGDVNRLVNGVQLLVGAKRPLFTARTSSIPLTVNNATDYAVRVVVRLRPHSGQLTFGRPVSVSLAPQTWTPVLIPARAIASGDVVVEGMLLTTTGQPLSASRIFTVRVRPNWETRGMFAAAVVLGLLVVVGLLRGIRRDRPRVPLEAVPDVDEQAIERAEADLENGPGGKSAAPLEGR